VRLLGAILLSCTFSFSIEISLHPSKTKEPSSDELSIKKELLQKRGIFRVPESKLKDFLRSNRVLGDQYLKEFNTTAKYKKTLTKHKLQLEEELANLYVQEKLQQTPVDDEVLLSYYVSHKEKFVEPPKLTVTIYKFDDYQKAYEAYEKKKFDIKGTKTTIPYKSIDPSIKEMFKDAKAKDILPPVFFRDSYAVFVVDDVQPKREKSFEEVKPLIKALLLEKIQSDFRKKLLESIDEK